MWFVMKEKPNNDISTREIAVTHFLSFPPYHPSYHPLPLLPLPLPSPPTMQGDRFGGALDAAAKHFSEAFDAGLIPMEFVNKMKKENKLIMGIGHRVKSVSCHGNTHWLTSCVA